MTCARCEELEERVAWLESELGLRGEAEQYAALHEKFGLSLAEARMAMCLFSAKGRIVTLDQLEEAVPPADPAADRDPKIVRVYISRLRGKLGADAVVNIWGRGYRMASAGSEAISAILGETPQTAA